MKHLALALSLAASFSLLAAARYGAPLTDAAKVPLKDIVAKADAYNGKTLKTEGKVSAVCQSKGCWMTFVEGDKTVRVTFKDYGFFVPKDIGGKTVVVEGVFKVKTIPEATAKHYAEETPGGKPDAIKGDQKELSFEATGVEVQ